MEKSQPSVVLKISEKEIYVIVGQVLLKINCMLILAYSR